jgi:hypothetical protein
MAMTEQEWLACDNVADVFRVDPLWGKVTDRKCRLFAVACCRRIRNLIQDQSLWEAVEVAETQADGFPLESELDDAGMAVMEYIDSLPNEPDSATFWAATAVGICVSARSEQLVYGTAYHCSFAVKEDQSGTPTSVTEESQAQCRLLREITGNPFRPVTIDPSWRTPNVTALAQAIYDERAFDRLPTLADALEDAGCDNADILNHCRQPGEHVRGCWVVDLVLGKE